MSNHIFPHTYYILAVMASPFVYLYVGHLLYPLFLRTINDVEAASVFSVFWPWILPFIIIFNIVLFINKYAKRAAMKTLNKSKLPKAKANYNE